MYDFEDVSCVDKIYEDYFSKIYNYVFYRLLHREQTEDIVSEVFLKVISNLNTFNSEKASFSTWIFNIAKNAIIDHIRKQRHVVYTMDGDAREFSCCVDFDEQCELILNEERKLLYKALAELDEKQRHIIALKYFGEFTNRKIAEMTGMNESSVSTVCFRAIAKLRAALKDTSNDL